MKQFATLGRIFLGIAYLIFGYLHFKYTQSDEAMVPGGIGSKVFWVLFVGVCWWATAISFLTNILTRISGILASAMLMFILLFTIIPHFNGAESWISAASIFAIIGGSIMVSAQGAMCPFGKKKDSI